MKRLQDQSGLFGRRVRQVVNFQLAAGLSVFTLFAATACGDSEDSGGGVAAADAPSVVAKALCGDYFDCGCDQSDQTFSSREDCELGVASTVQASIDEGKAAGLTYDDTYGPKLTSLVAAADCRAAGDLGFDVDLMKLSQSFSDAKLFYGSAQPGQPCTTLERSNGDDCVRGTKCEGGVCSSETVHLAQGEPCGGAKSCSAGLLCVSINGDGAQTCESLPSVGATCLGTADLCTTTAVCDQTSKKCVELPKVGQPCGARANVVLRRCTQGAVCEQDSCVAAPGAGEACTVDCQTGFKCEGSRCVAAESVSCQLTRGVAAAE